MNIYKEIESDFIKKFKDENDIKDIEFNYQSLNQIDLIIENDKSNIMVEVYATVGKALSAKKRKLVSDAFKMLYYEKKIGKKFDKYIITVDDADWKNSIENTWQIDAFKELGINILYFEISGEQKDKLQKARDENLGYQKV